MNFINETMHPLTLSLVTSIRAAFEDYGQYTEGGRFYTPLELWRQHQGLSDERTADLYARIEEGLAGYITFTQDKMADLISLYLWQNEQEFMQ